MQDTDRPMDRPTEPEAFLLEEYKHLTESFLRNEELGERRFNFFTALIAAVLVAFGTVYQKAPDLRTLAILVVLITLILLLYGIMTLARVVRRDIVTDQYLRGINKIRRYFADKNTDIVTYLYRNPYEGGPFRKRKLKGIISLENGGLTKTMELLNSVIAMVLAAALVKAYGLPAWLTASVPAWLTASVPAWLTASVPAWLAASVLAGLAALILQFVWVKWKYEGAKALWEASYGYTDQC